MKTELSKHVCGYLVRMCEGLFKTAFPVTPSWASKGKTYLGIQLKLKRKSNDCKSISLNSSIQ